MIVDLFAGPGGWDEGLRRLGRTDVVGFELDEVACATARAAGHERVRCDVAAKDPAEYAGAEGVIASPPCGGLSSGGLKLGRRDLELVHELLSCLAEGEDCRADYLFEVADPRSLLLVEPLRWLIGTGAGWLALEQVPAALPVWEWYEEILGLEGWSVWTGVVDAADFGVPQERRRAVLLAGRAPLHVEPPRGAAELVPAGSVLGPGWHGFPRRNDRDDGGQYRARDFRSNERPSFTLTEKARSWTVSDGASARPLNVSEAGRLQSFPGDYPWSGSRSRQFLQVANAVPPALAAELLRPLVGVS